MVITPLSPTNSRDGSSVLAPPALPPRPEPKAATIGQFVAPDPRSAEELEKASDDSALLSLEADWGSDKRLIVNMYIYCYPKQLSCVVSDSTPAERPAQ